MFVDKVQVNNPWGDASDALSKAKTRVNSACDALELLHRALNDANRQHVEIKDYNNLVMAAQQWRDSLRDINISLRRVVL